MLLMQESYTEILAAVITGNASTEQHSSFNQLMHTNNTFRELYEQFQTVYHQNQQTPSFNADEAFEKMKIRLSM
jgi:hypothetical protein